MAPSNDQIPLDVNYAKIAEWLAIRQKLPKDWHRKMQIIISKAEEAAESLPAGLKGHPDGSAFDYPAAKHIRDIPAQTSDKSLFGGLLGPASVWDKIVRAYEKDNIFLGECSLILARNVDYEIPFYKRQKGKYQQQLSDLERKQTEHLHSAALAAKAYQQECEAIGIQGVKIISELRALVKELPGVFLEVGQSLQSADVSDAMQYYAQFLTSTSTESLGCSATGLLPTLTAVREADLAADLAASHAQQDTATAAAGSREAQSVGAQEIAQDAGTEMAGEDSTGDAAGEISWDIDLSAVEKAAPVEAESGGAIDWDIDVAETAQPAEVGEDTPGHVDGSVQCSAAQSNPEAGGMLSTLVSDGELRSRLLDELHELSAFLRMRASELSSSSSSFVADAADTMPDVSAGTVIGWLQELEGAISKMTHPKTGQLLLYRSSERYLDRVTADMQQKAGQEKKFRRMAQEVEGRRQMLQKSLSYDARKLSAVLQKTRDIKSLVEDSLLSQFNRPVLVVGEINNALD